MKDANQRASSQRLRSRFTVGASTVLTAISVVSLPLGLAFLNFGLEHHSSVMGAVMMFLIYSPPITGVIAIVVALVYFAFRRRPQYLVESVLCLLWVLWYVWAVEPP